MKIIIPMSGIGKRFVEAGYWSPKPLIKVDGKPIIEHVISMFPKGSEFIFICNNNHRLVTSLETTLITLVPDSTIIWIDPHDKGPVHATTYVYPYIKDDEEVLISYCDYYMTFDVEGMLEKVRTSNYAGAVPSYTGFHPHLLHKKLYGGVKVDSDNLMLEYQEKHSFTDDPMKSHHSVGMYYFKNGREFKTYSDELLASDIRINGEAYTSMVYYLYLRDSKKIYVPEPTHFMQWGTPEDLEEYEAWSRYFHQSLNKEKKDTEIPVSRNKNVSIPYNEDTELFKKCRLYWGSYFTTL